ncbi:MAG: DUF5606 domain-containing protein [Bacteroidaceae bacterium]|nr:DUF5606 domain-containing protein [Bacteroidaceae bacterium]
MLKTILSITGKPGLYKLVSQGKNMFIVESLGDVKKRLPVHGNEKVISLGDIAMFTDDAEVPLSKVFSIIAEKENKNKVSLDVKKASKEDLFTYFAQILPDFDRDRVYSTDVKKLITWYNLLVTSGMTDFDLPEKEAKTEETAEEA